MNDYYAIIERDENGELFGYIPQLRGCHTQGESVADLMGNLEEALNLYLEANPEARTIHVSEFVGVQRMVV